MTLGTQGRGFNLADSLLGVLLNFRDLRFRLGSLDHGFLCIFNKRTFKHGLSEVEAVERGRVRAQGLLMALCEALRCLKSLDACPSVRILAALVLRIIRARGIQIRVRFHNL